MFLTPIKTRIFNPPKDDLYQILDEYLTDVRERDLVAVTSKVVAIHEGRCIPMDTIDKPTLIRREAEYLLDTEYRPHPLTVKYHALISSAGIDESNGDGYYVLLPTDPYRHAREIHRYLKNRFGLNSVGVIITDSHSLPFRYGAMSVSIGSWGFKPVESHIGKPDLFGRPMKYSSTNIVDSLSAACALVSGECDEAQPIVVLRDVPNIVYTEEDVRDELLIPREEDIYKVLYKDFKKPDVQG
jgi:dihydrofolate synthase / folylpolyglutamate synthase